MEKHDELFCKLLANIARQDGEATPKPLEPPAIHCLKDTQVPTLVTVGDLDTTGALVMASVLEQNIPEAHKVTFSGAAHMIPMEQPERFNQVMSDFLGNN